MNFSFNLPCDNLIRQGEIIGKSSYDNLIGQEEIAKTDTDGFYSGIIKQEETAKQNIDEFYDKLIGQEIDQKEIENHYDKLIRQEKIAKKNIDEFRDKLKIEYHKRNNKYQNTEDWGNGKRDKQEEKQIEILNKTWSKLTEYICSTYSSIFLKILEDSYFIFSVVKNKDILNKIYKKLKKIVNQNCYSSNYSDSSDSSGKN